MKAIRSMTLILLALTAGCSDIDRLANTDSGDTTAASAYPDAEISTAGLLSAFYGLDDAIPFIASYRICGEFGHSDGMPAIFATEVDTSTVEAGDFLVTLADGQEVSVGCVTPAPAADPGELRTMLLIGDFGSINNQPITVTVTGNVMSLDQQVNYRGSTIEVTALEAGPTLILAEPVSEDEWDLGKEATSLPFGGGDSCPASTRQVIRAVWRGGITKPGGDEIGDLERSAYRVITIDEDGTESVVAPFAIGDLGDGDNNHELCLDTEARVIRVEFPADLMTDPREDLNTATSVTVLSGAP